MGRDNTSKLGLPDLTGKEDKSPELENRRDSRFKIRHGRKGRVHGSVARKDKHEADLQAQYNKYWGLPDLFKGRVDPCWLSAHKPQGRRFKINRRREASKGVKNV